MSCWRGSRPTLTAWTTWSGCGGRTGSCARAAGSSVAGGWATAGSGAPGAIAYVGDGGHDLRPDAHAADGVVHGCWLFATQKDGVSAQSLQRALEIGSYQTAWAMLHRLRSVLVRPGRERLTGTVEVDETFIGGEEPGLRGGRARGQEVPGRRGRRGQASRRGSAAAGWRSCTDASAASLHPFVAAHVEPGATVITDGWQGYSGINELGYVRDRRSQRAARARGDDPFGLLPGVHRVASLAKRWLLGTHQGSVDEAHLQSYLDEFVFRFNRRTSRSRGLVFHRVLELAVGHEPVRYRDLIVDPQPKTHPPAGRPAGVTRRASSDRRRTAHGEPPDLGWSG